MFYLSGSSVDAPSLNGSAGQTTSTSTTNRQPPAKKLVTVQVASGGPAGTIPNIEASPGGQVRFRVTSDLTETIEVQGYGIAQEVPAGRTLEFHFKARKRGEFPILVQATHIGVARLIVGAVKAPPLP